MSYKIHLAVKAAGTTEQLANAIGVAKEAGITGLEIQALPSLLGRGYEANAREVVESCRGRDFAPRRVAYHMPFSLVNGAWEGMTDARKHDLCSPEGGYMMDTLEKAIMPEAAMVGEQLGIQTEIPVIVHLLGFTEHDRISREKRKEMLIIGEAKFSYLQSRAKDIGRRGNCEIAVVRENNTPNHKVNVDVRPYPVGLVDYDTGDLLKAAKGVTGVALDLSHLQLFYNYIESRNGDLPGVNVDVNSHGGMVPPLIKTVNEIAPYIRVLHLSDAGIGYSTADEGLTIGEGIVDFNRIIPAISRGLGQDVIGTLEIDNSHINPEKMRMSHAHLKRLFGEAFSGYFA
jgi:hypothetical protein